MTAVCPAVPIPPRLRIDEYRDLAQAEMLHLGTYIDRTKVTLVMRIDRTKVPSSPPEYAAILPDQTNRGKSIMAKLAWSSDFPRAGAAPLQEIFPCSRF